MRFSSRVCVKRVVELDPFTRPMLQHPKHIKQPPSRITLELPSLSRSRERVQSLALSDLHMYMKRRLRAKFAEGKVRTSGSGTPHA